ncbi:hypothetical protein JCGZ_23987 [Jatropha curcas]|uniref:CBS domain-containing protein n=1 Tax=Jatropha curcas TaxID=180498 RepID=A0A067JZM0_JATCU|nr:CBS domain-containing protein CBSX1, chloroplastic [Jatropha curcas]KDP25004.1 hypothetical protein JCGZ_23987 [Jatropha curcas]
MASMSLTASTMHSLPHCLLNYHRFSPPLPLFSATSISKRRRLFFSYRQFAASHRIVALASSTVTNNGQPRNGICTVGNFMTRKEDLYVAKTTTTIDEALEAIVEKKISGIPVVDDDWILVGVVSDYDLLALNTISGDNQSSSSLFPDADSSWKAFNEMQKLLTKNNGKVVGDLMTPSPLVVNETTHLEDAARLLLDTKYHQLPVVDGDGKLVGIITRETVVTAALQIKNASERSR